MISILLTKNQRAATMPPMEGDTAQRRRHAASADEVLRARLACENLFQGFAECIDSGRATAALELFAPDAVLEARGATYEGHDSILEFLAAREARTERHSRHVGVNFSFRLTGEASAEASALMILFGGDGDIAPSTVPEAIVDCELTFGHDADGAWRVFSRRHRPFAIAGRPGPQD
jgi:hypothetical protein